jgi:hypothetical protein
LRRALLGKPSGCDFIGETMNFENRNVNRVSLTGRALIDKGASAVFADPLNERLTRSECEPAANQ